MNTSLVFQNTTFDITDRNGQPWLNAAQIGAALGYADESAISRIFLRNKDEFTPAMTETVNLTGSGNLKRETRIFSLRGAHLLAMLSRTPIAKEFRRWVLDLLEKETVPALPAPAWPQVDFMAAVMAAHKEPEVPMSPVVQSAINRRAWALSHDAYELCRAYLARRVGYTCVEDYPRRLFEGAALREIEAVTLNEALIPKLYKLAEGAARAARVAAEAAIHSRDEIQQAVAALR